ncbi:Crossover junction endonuclease MUS81 [Armadillidium vulgare]|nr:Crossover junction endonuclease MUS81 [Armadillidium vulgare]
MDDLGRSIRDGRFKEQKFRLKRSGLTQLIYLVEEYGSTHSVTPIPTCEQAVTNTQIIDDFKIKVVKDQRESAVYLAIMTRAKLYTVLDPESKFLSKENIANDSSFYFMNFKDLNSTSAKNRLLSIRDMFAKHLLQIFGASVDKVTSLIQKYPTPQTLITALECQSVENENYQISDIRCEKTGRMVDQTLLSQIAKLYTRETLL